MDLDRNSQFIIILTTCRWKTDKDNNAYLDILKIGLRRHVVPMERTIKSSPSCPSQKQGIVHGEKPIFA